jgi:hypothetical protein
MMAGNGFQAGAASTGDLRRVLLCALLCALLC